MTIQMIKRPNHDVSKGFMLEAEVDCMRFIMKRMPSYLNYFVVNLENGRKGILHKLASSLFRENINDIYKEAIDLRKVGSSLVVRGEKNNELSKELYSHLKAAIVEEMTYKVVSVNKGALVFPIQHEYAFQRIETTGRILYIDDSGVSEVKVASELIQLLFEQGAQVESFISELDNGTANLTLAYMFDDHWRKNIQEEAKTLQAASTLEYLDKKGSEISPSLFFEQLILEGHHLHPGAKTKIGLSQHDVFRFSPEFHQSFGVRFVAVAQAYVMTTASAKRMLEEYFYDEWKQCLAELEKNGVVANEYDIIPVHEWQYEHAIPDVYEEEIRNGIVRLIEGVTLKAQATSSFRTVYAKNKKAPSLKLAVNSQMTSTVRSISMQTAMNSTLFTNMMTQIMKQEKQLKDFVPLNELAGMAFKSDEELKSRNLTMLLRESIDEKLTEGEVAIAGPALYSRSPLSEDSILAELVDHYAEVNNVSNAVFPFFDDYIEKVIPGYLTLMVKYGIALEGHLQNSIPVFKNGRLSRFFFRDWGGSRIYQARLDQQGIPVSFTPGSVSVTKNVSDMHNKLYYTVFQNHLGEVIRQLVQYSGRNEEAFWLRVKKVCDHTFEELSHQSTIEENVALDRSFVYQSTVMHKSLTKMRLSNKKGDSYCEVSNPLAHLGGDNG